MCDAEDPGSCEHRIRTRTIFHDVSTVAQHVLSIVGIVFPILRFRDAKTKRRRHPVQLEFLMWPKERNHFLNIPHSSPCTSSLPSTPHHGTSIVLLLLLEYLHSKPWRCRSSSCVTRSYHSLLPKLMVSWQFCFLHPSRLSIASHTSPNHLPESRLLQEAKGCKCSFKTSTSDDTVKGHATPLPTYQSAKDTVAQQVGKNKHQRELYERAAHNLEGRREGAKKGGGWKGGEGGHDEHSVPRPLVQDSCPTCQYSIPSVNLCFCMERTTRPHQNK